MKFKRMLYRSRNRRPHCCGQKMVRKESYDDEHTHFYFCEKCGREKRVKGASDADR